MVPRCEIQGAQFVVGQLDQSGKYFSVWDSVQCFSLLDGKSLFISLFFPFFPFGSKRISFFFQILLVPITLHYCFIINNPEAFFYEKS